jgi:tetratricopeptide (TPR) repeat protein
MRFIKYSFIFLIILSLFAQCGKDPEAEGDNAYARGKYNQALTFYLKVKKNQPNNARLDEKIALTYMQRGRKLYTLRHNVDAFQLNYEKSKEFIPKDSLSDNFKKEYSKLLYDLALAYYNAKPQNDIQKEKFFNLTLDYLEKALEYDYNNAQADAKLSEIRTENFQKYFNKGKEYYQRALKDPRNTNLFLSAEAYLLQAVRMDENNKEAQKLLSKVRKKTMSILDISRDVPLALAIGNQKYTNGNLALSITVFNNTIDPYPIDPKRFHLYDRDENEYEVNLKATGDFAKGLTEVQNIPPKKDVDWVIVFTIKKSARPDRLIYETEDGIQIGKYFP